MKYLVSLNGKQYEVIVEHHTANVTNVTPFVSERSPKESSIEQKQAEHLGSLGNPPANSTAVKAPLPGTITKLNVKNGQNIKRGAILCILEAMKMENVINADRDGKVIEIKVNKGDSVLEGADLLIIE